MISQFASQCFKIYCAFIIPFKLKSDSVIGHRANYNIKRMFEARLRGIAIGIDKLCPFCTDFIRKNLYVQVAMKQTTVIKLKSSNDGFSIAHDAHPPLCHRHRL